MVYDHKIIESSSISANLVFSWISERTMDECWQTFFFPARAFIPQPAIPEPVKVSSLNRSSTVNISASCRETGRIEKAPFGSNSQASNISPNTRAERGVRLLGFRTNVHPTAKAGATLCATKLRGKFQGLTIETGPIGNFLTIPCSSTFNTVSVLGVCSKTERNANYNMCSCS